MLQEKKPLSIVDYTDPSKVETRDMMKEVCRLIDQKINGFMSTINSTNEPAVKSENLQFIHEYLARKKTYILTFMGKEQKLAEFKHQEKLKIQKDADQAKQRANSSEQ